MSPDPPRDISALPIASSRPAPGPIPGAAPARVLVIGCGALAREIRTLVERSRFDGIHVRFLPATLHNRPERIPGAVARRIAAARASGQYGRIFVAYGDCGTGGLLDRLLEAQSIERLPGAHCYEFYAGSIPFARLLDAEPGTFFLTDFLVRAFDRLVFEGLGLDRHPELLPLYFGNYRRVVYLSQVDDPGLVQAAQAAALRLGLAFEHEPVGFGELERAIDRLGLAASA